MYSSHLVDRHHHDAGVKLGRALGHLYIVARTEINEEVVSFGNDSAGNDDREDDDGDTGRRGR